MSTIIASHEPLHIAEWATSSGQLQVPPSGHLALLLVREAEVTCRPAGGPTLASPVGTLLLLGPADCWHLDTQPLARLAWLCFSLDYLASHLAGHPQVADWQLLQARGAAIGSTGHLPAAKVPPALAGLLALLVDCYAGRPSVAQDTLASPLVGTVLRALGPLLAPAQPGPAASHAASVVRQVLAYIRRHAAAPERLHLGHLAQEFAYSPSHLSALFRQHMREPLHQYIVRHRLQLVENQLQASALTVSQIADELGFVDVCHLNKQFKKRYHLTPTEYRRQLGCSSPLSYA